MTGEALCMFCNNLKWDYDPGSNCPTCGYEASGKFVCGRGHWNMRVDEDFIDDIRSVLRKAESCKDYDQVKVKKVTKGRR